MGKATLTMVLSSPVMSRAPHSTARTSHGLVAPARTLVVEGMLQGSEELSRLVANLLRFSGQIHPGRKGQALMPG